VSGPYISVRPGGLGYATLNPGAETMQTTWHRYRATANPLIADPGTPALVESPMSIASR
jgi:hypothetical protein